MMLGWKVVYLFYGKSDLELSQPCGSNFAPNFYMKVIPATSTAAHWFNIPFLVVQIQNFNMIGLILIDMALLWCELSQNIRKTTIPTADLQ